MLCEIKVIRVFLVPCDNKGYFQLASLFSLQALQFPNLSLISSDILTLAFVFYVANSVT